MTFLHPWALVIGVAAAAAPVLIHWLTSPRPVRMPLSTIRFLREAVHERRSWRRLRDTLLLCLRTLAILLIALAVARPQWGQSRQVSDLQQGDAVRVVLLDLSQSMAARAGNVEHIQRARTLAAEYLRYRPGLSANLILAAARPQAVFDTASNNFDALRDELARCRVLPQRLDVNRALDLAARILAPTGPKDHRRRELVLVSDFQRSSWGGANFSPLPTDTHIQFESVAPPQPPANLAILRVEPRAADLLGSTQLAVDVGNYTPNDRKVTVEISVGTSSWRLTGTAPAHRVTTLTEEIGSRGLGWQSGEAKLVAVDDALAADNLCPFVLHMRPPPKYAIITRQPSGRRPTSSMFLECALAPSGGKSQRDHRPATDVASKHADLSPTVVRVDPATLDRATVTESDLIALDHPGKLTPETIELLADLLRRGRPILYVASEMIDATNLKRLREGAGAGLQLPVEFLPPPAGQTRRDLMYTSVRRDSPPFRVFGDALNPLTSRLRFAGGISSRRLDAGLESDILATYNDGTAGIVLASSDAGELAVINADLAASDLPKTFAFVPLMAELVGHMLDRGQRPPATACGEPLVAQLPAEAGRAAGLRLSGPAAKGDGCGQLGDQPLGVQWRWLSPGPTGVYRVEREGRTLYAAALTIPPEESDLDSLRPKDLTDRLAAGRVAAYRGAADEGQSRDDLWKWFAVACVVCIMGEISMLLGFRT
ncbi:MAG: BatA and WFA domain-containing protein [Planctomycetaceae bacterium]|nr:BatA and WFA domain-containing protein [Planctomycetaceae bacterium]